MGRHYRGELGEEYFDWQGSGADVNAEIESTKFAPHVSATDTVVDFGCGAGALLATLEIGERIGVVDVVDEVHPRRPPRAHRDAGIVARFRVGRVGVGGGGQNENGF